MRKICVAAMLLMSAPLAAQTANTTYIHAGQLLDEPGKAPRGASTIIVRDGKVADVRDGFVAPEGHARLVDLKTQFVLPRLIDMHVHIANDDNQLRAQSESSGRDHEDRFVIALRNARKTLEAGFTTVRDLGSGSRLKTTLRDAVTAGEVAGPTIIVAAGMISVTAGHGDYRNGLNRDLTRLSLEDPPVLSLICNGVEDCVRATRAMIAAGAEVIKFAATGGVTSNIAAGLGKQMSEAEMKAIVDTAHDWGLKATAHAHGKDGIDAALRAGVDSIEHGSFIDDETVKLFKAHNAALVPTLIASRGSLARARRGEAPPPQLAKAEQATAAHDNSFARALKGGVRILFGTDSGSTPSGDNAKEFALMVGAGMTPAQAIKAATVDNAAELGRPIGAILPGRDADIIAVTGNPLTDVTLLEKVGFVMRRGVVHRLGGKRQPFPPE